MPDEHDGSTPDEPRPEPWLAPWERHPPPQVRPDVADERDDWFAAYDDAPATRRRRQRWALLAGKVGVAALAVVVLLTTATGWVATEWLDGRFRQVSALDPDSDAVTDLDAQNGDENFLVVGSDTRIGAQDGDDIGTVSDVGGARADTIMIAHLPADRSRAVIVSFPRDLEIERPPCAVWDPVTGEYSTEIDPGSSGVKINTAYQVGGPRCITRVVQQLSGIAVNHFLGIDFQGFKGMVDAVDGVAVCVEQPLEDEELGLIIPRPGPITISGDTALDFVRARNVVGDPTGDYGRIIRQQKFLSALLRDLLSSDTLLSPSTLRSVADAVAANTFGENLQVSDLLQLAQSLQGLEPGEVTFVTVPTEGAPNSAGNEVLLAQETTALFGAIIAGSPLPGEAPATSRAPRPSSAAPTDTGTTTTSPSPDLMGSQLAPKEVLLRVLNGGGVAGSAASATRALQALGFGVVETGNAAELVDTTVIRYPSNRAAEARALQAALPSALLEVDDSQIGVLVLIVGPEFDGLLTQPPEPGAPAVPPPDLATVNGADAACA